MTTITQQVELIQAVPRYSALKRQHGRLMKDFGLFKHQRKAVYDLISTFMHANSHQNFLRETSPSELRTHKDDLRKSQELVCQTLEQVHLSTSSPLTSTDSESDDDTPPPTPLHQRESLVHDLRAKVQSKQTKINDLNQQLETLEQNVPTQGVMTKLFTKDLYKRRSHRHVWTSNEIDSLSHEKAKHSRESNEYSSQKKEIVDDLIQSKREIGGLRKELGNVDKTHKSEVPIPPVKVAVPKQELRTETTNSDALMAKLFPSDPRFKHQNPAPPFQERRVQRACPDNAEKELNSLLDKLMDKEVQTLTRKFNLAKLMSSYTNQEEFKDSLSTPMLAEWQKACQSFRRYINDSRNTYINMNSGKYDDEYIFKRYCANK